MAWRGGKYMPRTDHPINTKIALALALAAFSYGVLSVRYRWPPYPEVLKAIQALEAREVKAAETRKVMRNKSLIKSRDQKNIVKNTKTKVIDAEGVFQGATLIAIGTGAAMLVDIEGQVLHRWNLPFSKAWGYPPHVPDPNPDPMVRFIDAEVFPNGDLLVIYHADQDTPYGYGMVKMNKNSEVIWKYARNAHHDMHIAADGHVYTLVHSYQKHAYDELGHFRSPMLADAIAVLSADGQPLDEIPLTEAFLDTPYEPLLFSQITELDKKKNDYLHANSVMRLEENIADKFPLFEAGQLLVSLRNLHTIAVIDPGTRKVVWAARGMWKMQHDAQFLPNGHILLFDNQGFEVGHKKPRSRLLEIDPLTQKVMWAYTGSTLENFYTQYHGNLQRLPNGNTLSVETADGNKIIEVTEAGNPVWRFSLRTRSEFKTPNPINKATRISYDFFDAPFREQIMSSLPAKKQQETASDSLESGVTEKRL